MDEASGTRYDSYGSNHLTDVNTVASASGKIGVAASLTKANVEEFYVADNTSLDLSGCLFTFTAWLSNASALGAGEYRSVLGRWHASNGDIVLALFRDATNYYYAFGTSASGNVGTDGKWSSTYYAAAFGTSAWQFICASRKGPTTTRCYANCSNGRENDLAAGVYNSTQEFEIGGNEDNASQWSWNGLIDEVCFWNGRALSADEELFIYNDGAGRSIV